MGKIIRKIIKMKYITLIYHAEHHFKELSQINELTLPLTNILLKKNYVPSENNPGYYQYILLFIGHTEVFFISEENYQIILKELQSPTTNTTNDLISKHLVIDAIQQLEIQ